MKLRQGLKGEEIYCLVRKKWVSHGPEEFVRQSIIQYLLDEIKIPGQLMAVEQSLTIFEPANRKLADIVCWQPSQDGKGVRPWLLVECKAPSVAISQKAADQAAGYLSKIPSLFVWLSNGEDNVYLQLGKEGGYYPIPGLPVYPSAKKN